MLCNDAPNALRCRRPQRHERHCPRFLVALWFCGLVVIYINTYNITTFNITNDATRWLVEKRQKKIPETVMGAARAGA